MRNINVIVIDGGIAGCIAAKAAANHDVNVILVESRSFLGHEINATNKTWIKNGSTDYELPMLIGSSKKFLLRQMLDKQVVPLLTSQVAAVAVKDKKASGILIGNKYGIQYLSGNVIIDTTSDRRTQRLLMGGNNYQVDQVTVHYSFEMSNTDYYIEDSYRAQGLDIINDSIHIHDTPFDNRVAVEFSFEMNIDQSRSNNSSIINNKAKMKAYEIACWLRDNSSSFQKARVAVFASEAFVEHTIPNIETGYDNIYSITSNLSYDYNTGELEELKENITKQVDGILQDIDRSDLQPDYFISGKTKLEVKDCKLSDFDDDRMKVKLKSVEFDFEQIAAVVHTKALVCGAGTAGSMAIRTLLENNTPTTIIEANAELGGTSVVGKVFGYWHGYKKGLNELVDSEIQRVTERMGNFGAARIIYNQRLVSENINNYYTGTLACGTILSQNTVKGVVAVGENGIFAVKADVTIDCTGDGDLVYLAKLPYSFGDQNDGVTQSFSQWGIDHQPTNNYINSKYLMDFDVVYNDKYSELLRGIYLAHGSNSDVNFSEMLTVRESRRMLGEYTLNIADIYNKVIFDDCVAVTSTPFDQHGVASSIFASMGFTVFSHDEVTTRIPYRCFIPKNIDGLLVGAKAFSATRDAASMCRMNADLRNAAYAIANAATIAINDNVSVREVDIKKLQAKVRSMGLLPDIAFKDETVSHGDMTQQIIDGQDTAAFRSMMMNDDRLIEYLKPHYMKAGVVNKYIAKVLAWFGDETALDYVAKDLLEVVSDKYTTDNTTAPRATIQYTLANQYIALLYKASNKKYAETLAKVAGLVGSGGKISGPRSAYYKARVDSWRIPHYDQLLVLAKAITRLPHPDAIKPLEKLLASEEIGGYVTPLGSTDVKLIFSAYLELHLACALARCGSKVGIDLLSKYVNEERYMLSRYAQHALDHLQDEVFGECII